MIWRLRYLYSTPRESFAGTLNANQLLPANFMRLLFGQSMLVVDGDYLREYAPWQEGVRR